MDDFPSAEFGDFFCCGDEDGIDRRGAEAAAEREQSESAGVNGFRRSAHWSWGGPGDGSRSRDEMRALDVLELESDATFTDVKAAYRRLAKEHHPDLKQGEEAAAAFQKVQAAYEVLRKAEERREASSPGR